MLTRVRVEHEVDERTLQLGALVKVDGEPRTGDLARAREVQDAEFGAEIPVRLGREIERAFVAPGVNHHVVFGAVAFRHGLVRQVGNPCQLVSIGAVDFFDVLLPRRD